MRRSRIAGLVLVSMAALAQQQPTVEITSEPSHHQVLANDYVRVFDVTVAPKATTFVHRHKDDYLFVTLGDSAVVSTRPGEKPVALKLKDGEVRYTPGQFAHSASNESDRPFHNITIELLKPSTNVKTCTEACTVAVPCSAETERCPTAERRIASDQWIVSMITMPAGSTLQKPAHAGPYLVVAVSTLKLADTAERRTRKVQAAPGALEWVEPKESHSAINEDSAPARFITLEFIPERR